MSRDLDGFLVGQLAGEDEPVLPFSYFPLSYAYQASLPKGTGGFLMPSENTSFWSIVFSSSSK